MPAKFNGPICVCSHVASPSCPHYQPGPNGCKRRSLLGYWDSEVIPGHALALETIAVLSDASIRTIERDIEKAFAKYRANPVFREVYPELSEAMDRKAASRNSSTANPPISRSRDGLRLAIPQSRSRAARPHVAADMDPGRAAVVRKEPTMKTYPTLLAELGAAYGSHELPKASIDALRTLAASGQVARFELELAEAQAKAPLRVATLDPHERNQLNPYLSDMMRWMEVSAADVAKHGPRKFTSVPNLDEIIRDSEARGDRMGTAK